MAGVMKASFLMEPKKPKPDTADLSENRIVVSKNITKDGMFVECIFFFYKKPRFWLQPCTFLGMSNFSLKFCCYFHYPPINNKKFLTFPLQIYFLKIWHFEYVTDFLKYCLIREEYDSSLISR